MRAPTSWRSIPPPFLFAAGFLGGLALERWVHQWPLIPASEWRIPFALAGSVAVPLEVALLMWAVLTFVRAHTAILPNRPASRVVRSGPYRFSRNPMYVALSALYLGLALVFNVAWPLVLWPVGSFSC
jgi:protein-S-isoprenylcysteine O-methyltransferase Ste14